MLPRPCRLRADAAAPRPHHRLLALALALTLLASLLSCSQPPATPVDPLAQWKRARAQTSSAPAVWVAYGDSITEGQGATDRQLRWIDQTLTSLRSRYPGSGADVPYLPGWYAVFPPDSPWQPYARRTGTVSNDSFGSLGLRTATLSRGASQTYALKGTAADLYYLTKGGVMAYTVDDGPPTTTEHRWRLLDREPAADHVRHGRASRADRRGRVRQGLSRRRR